MDNTSIGQPAASPKSGDDRSTQATTEGVDAQNANEFDARHGLAGAEAKPFRKGAGKRDHTHDEDLNRERLEPGHDAEGKGGVGADPAGHHKDSNSNT